jgi:hypothetical protein
VNAFFALILLSQMSSASPDAHPGRQWLEPPMGMVGSFAGGATAWGAYALWELGSKAVLSDSLDQVLDIIGAVELFGLGYGLFIPLGSYTGVLGSAFLSGDIRPEWGAALGAWAGSAASVPFAVMVLDSMTWPRAVLAAGTTLLLPALGSWLGYKLTPVPLRGTSINNEESKEVTPVTPQPAPPSGENEKSFRPLNAAPYFAFDGRSVSAGLRVGF